MGTVTYRHQPGIHATRGSIPLAGTRHVYKVTKVLWPEEVETFITTLLIPPCLHVCAGRSHLGDIRLDIDPENAPHIVGDAAKLPIRDRSVASVLCDPPYNGRMQWNHDMLTELSRVTQTRIIFQHWFLPINPDGKWKKWHVFELRDVYIWQPRTYFGRVQAISVLERVET